MPNDGGNQDPNAGGNQAGSGGNPDPNQGGGAAGGQQQQGGQAGGGGKWYSSLEGDLANHPAMQKFESPTALAKAYLDAEVALGGEKVINPFKLTDEKRPVAMQRFNAAIGVPSDATGYGLKAPEEVPDGVSFDTGRFAAVAHKYGLRPDQAEGLFNEYTGEFIGLAKSSAESHQAALNASETALRKEWGQAYDANVKLASQFVHKFGGEGDFDDLNAALSTNPKFLRMMANAGKVYGENSVGGFKDPGSSRFTPQQAQEEYDKIVNNPKDDYYSDINSVRQRRIKYVESLVEQGANPSMMA